MLSVRKKCAVSLVRKRLICDVGTFISVLSWNMMRVVNLMVFRLRELWGKSSVLKIEDYGETFILRKLTSPPLKETRDSNVKFYWKLKSCIQLKKRELLSFYKIKKSPYIQLERQLLFWILVTWHKIKNASQLTWIVAVTPTKFLWQCLEMKLDHTQQ